MTPDDFRPIPGHPGYRVARDGRVMGSCDFVLTVSKGSVSLKAEGKYVRRRPEDLAALVWGKQEQPGRQEPAPAPVECPPAAEAPMDKRTPVTATTPAAPPAPANNRDALKLQEALARVSTLTKELEQLRALLHKTERQRDNLAAGRILEVATR